MWVSGWGVKVFRGDIIPGPPQKVEHVLVSDEECNTVMNKTGLIKEGRLNRGCTRG